MKKKFVEAKTQIKKKTQVKKRFVEEKNTN